jgi:hypothetical protein
MVHDAGVCLVGELDADARCSRMREDAVSVARIEMHAVLCKRQLQPWSVDTRRLLCDCRSSISSFSIAVHRDDLGRGFLLLESAT